MGFAVLLQWEGADRRLFKRDIFVERYTECSNGSVNPEDLRYADLTVLTSFIRSLDRIWDEY